MIFKKHGGLGLQLYQVFFLGDSFRVCNLRKMSTFQDNLFLAHSYHANILDLYQLYHLQPQNKREKN